MIPQQDALRFHRPLDTFGAEVEAGGHIELADGDPYYGVYKCSDGKYCCDCLGNYVLADSFDNLICKLAPSLVKKAWKVLMNEQEATDKKEMQESELPF